MGCRARGKVSFWIVTSAFTAGKRAVLEMHRSCHPMRWLMLPGRPEHAKGHARWLPKNCANVRLSAQATRAFTEAVAFGLRLAT
jgi:hypothetical protein